MQKMSKRNTSFMVPDTQGFVQLLETGEMSAERAAQVESVLQIIDESIEKLKISLILPRIFENPITLRQYLSGSKYERFIALVLSYLKDKKMMQKLNPVEAHLSYRLVKLIDMFQENYEMLESLPSVGWLEELSDDDQALLDAFYLLRSITEQRLQKSAMSELTKEKKIHQIYHENERIKKNILEFHNKLRNQKINLRWKMAAKDGIIRKYEEDLAFKKWDNSLRIKEEIVKSSRRIRNIQQTSVSKQKDLEEELEKTKATYDKVLKQNLHQEKEARDEKNKLLLQLQSLIKKYDNNIGEKIKENTYLQEVFDEQKRQFEEFLVEYQREEEEYETIVRQKEMEEKRKHEEKLMLFMMNRAARVIQKYWRRYRREKKKKSKKGGKGGKGKKK